MISRIHNYPYFTVYVLSLCITYIFTGCTTFETTTIPAENIIYEKDYEIYSLTLKDSSIINIEKPEDIRFYARFNDSLNIFVLNLYDTLNYADKKNSIINKATVKVPLYKVSQINAGRNKFSLGNTLIFTGVVAFVCCIFFLARQSFDYR